MSKIKKTIKKLNKLFVKITQIPKIKYLKT